MFVNPKIIDFLKNPTEEKSKLIVSVYAICKDEIKNVEDWVAQFDKCDHICVLDTGSHDGTFEKLQELAVTNKKLIISQKKYKVFHYDEARNDSFKLIPTNTDVCITFDFDERLEPDWFSKFISIDREQLLNTIFKVKRNNIIGSEVVSSHKRLFSYPYKQGCQLKWAGFVYESLVNDFSSLKDIQKEFTFLNRDMSDISCNHYMKSDLERLKVLLKRQSKYVEYFLYLSDMIQETDNFFELMSLLECYFIDYGNFHILLNQKSFKDSTCSIIERNIRHIMDVIINQKINVGAFENKKLIDYIIYQTVCLRKVYDGKIDVASDLQYAILNNSSNRDYCQFLISKYS